MSSAEERFSVVGNPDLASCWKTLQRVLRSLKFTVMVRRRCCSPTIFIELKIGKNCRTSILKKRTLISATFAATITFTTMMTASYLGSDSATRNPPVNSSPVVLKTPKEQPRVKKRIRIKPKELKNIKQAPRVSPNLIS